MTYNTLHIFTDDALRINDNNSLLSNLENTKNLYTVFYYGHIKKINHIPPHRVIFLLESLKNLKERLDEYGIPLYFIDEPMFQSLRMLISKWNINRVTTEPVVSIVGKRDQLSLRNFLSAFGVMLRTYNSSTLYDTVKVPVNITRSEFFRIITQMEPELSLPEELTEFLSKFSSFPDPFINKKIPSLSEFGITNETMSSIDTKFRGGETAAILQLEKLIANRCEPNNLPKVAQLNQYDAISPAIKFGCISVRTIYNRVSKLEPKYNEVKNQIYDGLRNRDYCILVGGNCPNIDNQGSIYTYILPWDVKQDASTRFQTGRTGYPFIDAAIAQLKREGFIHNSVKNILVRTLTCDLMWIGWHEGVRMFYKWSLDYNAAICALSWMHGSKSTWLLEEISISQINPIEEAKEIDKDGDYIRKYLPELKDYPSEYIHTPWLAPLDQQIESECVIGQDYPYPNYCDVEERVQQCRKRLQIFYNIMPIAKKRRTLSLLKKRTRININNNDSVINIRAQLECKATKLSQ
uniref:Cryptochrome n=1 Tax=Crateromorpha meyeri TaxID=472232 RepID=D5G3Q4_9METZ|nr:cryptochrome [Crateromorpha meyeri]